MVTRSNNVAGIETQRPGEGISKQKDCSGRYSKERALACYS